MQTLFDTCFNDCYQEPTYHQARNDLATIEPEPMKFRVAKSLNLLDPILKNFALPRRKQTYKFPRKNLYFLETESNSIPFVYTSVPTPSQAVLLIYCHGSGSTLNHVNQYTNALAWKFGVATIAYDYTGDGESQKEFVDFESDLKCILAWAVKQGYDLRRIILCGFSLGSYSALCLKGQMPRILISPLCGITSYIQQKPMRYEGQKFDNLGKALEIKSRVWITHCSKQLIPISHAEALTEALLKNNKPQEIHFTEIKQGYDHKSAPGYLCTFLVISVNQEGAKKLEEFISKTKKLSHETVMNDDTKKLKNQLLQISKNLSIKTASSQTESNKSV